MRHILTFVVDAENPDALVDECAAWQKSRCAVTESRLQVEERKFRVHGVETTKREEFTETVTAIDEDAAKEKVKTNSKIVNVVVPVA